MVAIASTVDWITPVITGGAAILGAVAGSLGSYLTTRSQVKLQKNLVEEQRKFDNRELKFKLYNDVLRINGENSIIDVDFDEFNIEIYRKNVRPVLFMNLHIVDPKVRLYVLDFDKYIELIGILAERGDKEMGEAKVKHLIAQYHGLMNIIQGYYGRE